MYSPELTVEMHSAVHVVKEWSLQAGNLVFGCEVLTDRQMIRFLFCLNTFSHYICLELCWMKQDDLPLSMIGVDIVTFVISILKTNKKKNR